MEGADVSGTPSPDQNIALLGLVGQLIPELRVSDGNERRIVDLIHRQHENRGIIVDIVVNPLRSEGKRGYALAPMRKKGGYIQSSSTQMNRHWLSFVG